jgi:hypothetical protein
LHRQFTYLFAYARKINELDTAAALVAMETDEQYDALVDEIDAHGLWDLLPDPDEAAVLMVTPPGFRRIATGADFLAWLPAVDEIEIA